jgi:hypothetical protein
MMVHRKIFTRRNFWIARLCLISGVMLLLAGCLGNMANQPRYKPLEASQFFTDQRSARPLVDGAVSWNEPVGDTLFTTGKNPDGTYSDNFPFTVTLDVLKHGQERYNIYCSPCHDYTGNGAGMIVQRGFSPPPSFHTDRLRQMPVGYFFDVITNGFGQMYSYAYRVSPADRWAIAAYIRALQFSQYANVKDLLPETIKLIPGTSP